MEKLYLYSQQKQDWELTVAQIMNSLLPVKSIPFVTPKVKREGGLIWCQKKRKWMLADKNKMAHTLYQYYLLK